MRAIQQCPARSSTIRRPEPGQRHRARSPWELRSPAQTSVCHSQSTARRQRPRTRRRPPHRNKRRRWRPARAPARTRYAVSRLLRPARTAALTASRAGRASTTGKIRSARRARRTGARGGDIRRSPVQHGAVEVRPIGRHEHQLPIGRLPQQEIGQPLLAAGADDQVGVGHVRRVEVRPISSSVIARGSSAPSSTIGGDPRGRARDLLARAVIERDHQRQPGIARGQLLRLLQQAPDVGIEVGALADHAHLAPFSCSSARSLRMKRRRAPSGRGLRRAAAASSPRRTKRW